MSPSCPPLRKSVGCRAWDPKRGLVSLRGEGGAADPSDFLPVLPGAAALYLLSNPSPGLSAAVSLDLRQCPVPGQVRTGASAPGSE